jgi:anaerobic magnesium-protoporphyrin IX monomethyl ester cyclase
LVYTPRGWAKIAKMNLDAIIIADAGTESFSGTNALRLHIDGKIASIQNIMRHIKSDTIPEDESRMCWSSAPKLNGLFLYSFLKHKGFEVELINNYTADKEQFDHYASLNPKMVIISTTFIMKKNHLHDLVKDIRTILPDTYIICGGPFVYSCYLYLQRDLTEPGYIPDQIKPITLFSEVGQEEPDVDLFIVALHGEELLPTVLENVKQGNRDFFPANSAKLNGDAYVFSQRIDDHSGPAAGRIDWDILPDHFFKSGVVSMQASYGCPYHCAFCEFLKRSHTLYIVPLDDLIEDMKKVQDRGVRYVWFVDDNFRLGKPDLNDVCKRIIDEKIDLRWMSFIRANTLEKIDPVLLQQAGCVEVQLGLESGDQQQLDNMNKQSTPEMYYNVIEKLMKHGINCCCYFLFGFPGETEESVKRTRDFIKSIEFPNYDGVLTWSFFPFALVPLSPVYEQDMRNKFAITGYLQDWKHATMDFSTATMHLLQIFMELQQSAILYRQDNQDSYLDLSPERRNEFVRFRHACAKLAIQNQLDMQAMVKGMKKILNQ